MNQWKIVSQKSIFDADLFDVKEIKFKNKEGEEKIHHIVERTPTVSVFPLTDSYEIYLVSQFRYTLKKITLEAVAGYIDTKEMPLAAAKRELEEETGIIAKQWEEIIRVEMAASVIKGKNHLFLAKGLQISRPKKEEGEEISLVKMHLSEAAKKVMNGEINHAASMIGILMLDKMRIMEEKALDKLWGQRIII